MSEQPALTAEVAEELFTALLLERNATDQLINPLICALDRRPVLERLITAVGDVEPPCRRRANAASAAYWVRCWFPPQERALRRAAYDAGARSPEEFGEYLRRHRTPPRPIDDVADLWPAFWRVCLEAFVTCDDTDDREILSLTFPLDPSCHPPESAELLRAAADIARRQPETFDRLLNGCSGFGHAI